MRRALAISLGLLASAPGLAWAHPPAEPGCELVSFAKLPAATFVKGPTAGQRHGAGALAGHAGPYVGKQPVQGFSGLTSLGDGRYQVLVDNGYGALENSADHRLTMYAMRPDWNTHQVSFGPPIWLTDPRRQLPWTLVHQLNGPARPLTGADLDPEAIARDRDGSWWIGDEHGPFLVHVAADGTVLAPPYALPGVRAPQSPYTEETASLRFMNALQAHGEARGAHRRPVLSPWHVLLADGDPATGAPDRQPGASELVDVKSLHAAGFAVVPWTVNERSRMDQLLKLGVDGLISDSPDVLYQAIAAFDANGDGRPGDYLDANGNVDADRFDAEGHRGARDLRPESTLPAFEAALDFGMSTLETDCGISQDGVPILSHDPHLEIAKTRRLDGGRMTADPAIYHSPAARLQKTYDRRMLLEGRPRQTLDPAASPVAVAFAKAQGLAGPHALLRLDQLFAFVAYYDAWYRSGPGAGHTEARKRAACAARVRYDVETKITPADEAQGLTPAPAAFQRAIAKEVAKAGLLGRTTIQSFDWRTLTATQAENPSLGTAFLLEDALPFAMRGPGAPATAAPYWPWRITAATQPLKLQRSGGIEAMGRSPDGRYLYPVLEKPLVGSDPHKLLVSQFDLTQKRWTGKTWWYPWDAGSKSVADLAMVNATQGLAIERDDGEGAAAKLKRLYLVTLGKPGTVLRKQLVADLMKIRNPRGLAGAGPTFTMPFWTIEGVEVLDAQHVLILNDNNYPFSGGRKAGVPDDDEWAILKLDRTLPLGKR